jgi:hypothetical protein
MASFKVHGWYEIEYEKRKGGRTLVFDDFWSEGSKAHSLADECLHQRGFAVGPRCVYSRARGAMWEHRTKLFEDER